MENETATPLKVALTVGLERCPFCGGEAAFGKVTYSGKTIREQGWTQDTFHSVNCISCGSGNRGLVGFSTQEKAARHWNKRSNVEWRGERSESRSHAGLAGSEQEGHDVRTPKL